MNTMDTFHQMDKSHQGYITEFNDKSEFEQRINTAWRRAEPGSCRRAITSCCGI